MKVRIIKTSEGYIPQVYTREYSSEEWYSLAKIGARDALWSEPYYIQKFCRHYTKWGAMSTLKKYLKTTLKKTKKLEAFTEQLKNPNVVYEAEV